MRNRLPIVYLVDSAGVNLPYQDGIFPGQYGAGRIFYYNSIMRRRLRIPQIAAVMGPCIAGGAYLPALSDVIIMVEGASFMGLGGPNLVKGATGQEIDAEPLGGAHLHTAISGVAHYMAKNDADCIERIRQRIRQLPARAGHGADRNASGAQPGGLVQRPAARSPFAIRNRRCDSPHFRCCRLRRIPARIRPGNAVRRRAAPRPSRGRHCEPPGISQDRRPATNRRHRLYRIGAQGGIFRGNRRTSGPAAHLFAGCFGFHGWCGGRTRGHHSRRSRNGGDHVVRDRSEIGSDAEPRQRRRLLRHGGTGIRSEFHF